jgi:pimeloyl-ACP methyl ester carboxylesterase
MKQGYDVVVAGAGNAADADITSRWRVISFDLPYHGRSMPPDGWWEKEYLLTTGAYAGMVMAFVSALGLQHPVMLGCSMGGGFPLLGRSIDPRGTL